MKQFFVLILIVPTLSYADVSTVRFSDITKKSGITFTHDNGAVGKKYYPEAFGSGVCVIDYDGDTWPDLFFVNGRSWMEKEQAASQTAQQKHSQSPRTSAYPVLYRNDHNGTFTDVTKKAGLAVESYGMGCAVGDYDNNGTADLVVTGFGETQLFSNTGSGRFENLTSSTGLSDHGWSTCAVWFDYDRDGDLDLFICHYVQWTPQIDLTCGLTGKTKLFCGPDLYRGESNRLYRNDQTPEGRRVFTDMTEAAGVLNVKGKTLGAALLDYNNDGWLDLVIANDQVPNFLYRNNHDGTFTDVSTILGFSAGRFGLAKAGMGIDVADLLDDGRAGILVGNFAKEGLTYHVATQPSPPLIFTDRAPQVGLKSPSLPFLTFGLTFFDADLDGLLDVATANGHTDEDLVNFLERTITFRQRPLFFLGQHDTEANTGVRFDEHGMQVGLTQPMVGRGVVFLDFDLDGDLDLVFTENGGPAHLYRNDHRSSNHWLRLTLVGTASNRDAIGAVVTVRSSGLEQTRMVKTGSSYLSQSEVTLTFGLGKAEQVKAIEIRWPSGHKQTLQDIQANQHLLLTEPVRDSK